MSVRPDDSTLLNPVRAAYGSQVENTINVCKEGGLAPELSEFVRAGRRSTAIEPVIQRVSRSGQHPVQGPHIPQRVTTYSEIINTLVKHAERVVTTWSNLVLYIVSEK